jgi:hypothetical protein
MFLVFCVVWFCFVCLHPVSCVTSVAGVSGTYSWLFVFILCLAYPMLLVSLEPILDCLSCVPNVAGVSGMSILDCLSSSCVLCTQCCWRLWSLFLIVCLHPVYCVPNVAGVSGMPILDFPFGFLYRLFIKRMFFEKWLKNSSKRNYC